ncbi:hypothetical protein D3C83_56240 [compost metagenome]
MSGRVMAGYRAVEAATDDLTIPDDHGADGHLPGGLRFFGKRQRLPHEILVVHPVRCRKRYSHSIVAGGLLEMS